MQHGPINKVNYDRSFTSSSPGILLCPSLAPALPSSRRASSLARALACMTTRRLLVICQGVVLGRGRRLFSVSACGEGGGGGGDLSLCRREESWMSTMYSDSVLVLVMDPSPNSGVLGVSMSMSDGVESVPVGVDSWAKAVSYAIVVSSISRKMMRASKNRTCALDGGRPIGK